MYRATALAAVSAFASPAFAETISPEVSQPHFYGSLGYSFQGAKGIELALGAQVSWNDLIYVRGSPLNFVMTDAEGFYRDSFSNGQSRCRDESNGRFASDESCTGLDYRVDAEAYLRLSPQLFIGGGAIHTVSSDFTPEREGKTDGFAALMFEVSRNFGVELRGGSDNAALRVRAAF